MFTLQLTEADVAKASYERYCNSLPTVQKRMEVLLLVHHSNLSYDLIGTIAGVHRDTVTDYIKLYQQAGMTGILKTNFKGCQSSLTPHAAFLEAHFAENPCLSSTQAGQTIEKLTGIKRSPTQIRAFLHKLGMVYQKTSQIPAKVSVVAQEKWKTEIFEPLLKKAQATEIELVFVDSVHCVLSVFLCFLWSFTRIFVKSSPGRQRLNIVGAVNAISKKITFLTNTTTVNAQTLIEFLTLLRETYLKLPIYIILDNARYQHCKFVIEFAATLDIHLVFLPPYSPNLNLIERLWKWLKKKCLYAKYYENFEKFSQAITKTLQQANQENQQELEKLLTLKFQTFR
jgi:transposase